MAALPHEVPKLGVSVNIDDDGTFAARLDAAIERSHGHKLIEGSAKVIEHSSAELREPGPQPLSTPLRRRA